VGIDHGVDLSRATDLTIHGFDMEIGHRLMAVYKQALVVFLGLFHNTSADIALFN
jgi:hypothetical protein